MLQFIVFAVIYAIMMFIWSFVFLNKSNDKLNQAFLYFISIVLLWMILSVSNNFSDDSIFGLATKTVYFYCMLNMSLFFLLFVYRLIKRKLDPLFWILVSVNVLTVFARYLFPIDYSDPTFWRYTDPVVSPIMSGTFCLPVVYALFLIFREYKNTKDHKLRVQMRYICAGMGIACSVSVISECILPTWFHINTHLSLMYCAILIMIIFVFLSIMKHKLFNMRSEYIYRKLFFNSGDGIILIRKNLKIISVNHVAREILQAPDIDSGDRITAYIKDYDFEADYKRREITIGTDGKESVLSITQYPIDSGDQDSAKLLTLTDITAMKLDQKREKELLLEKTFTDQLTGLFNKHYFIEYYFSDRPEFSGRQFAVLFIDVDNFKTINDVYGHLTGDCALKSLADCIKANIDDRAKAVRFGGDEFLIIYENATADEGSVLAEKIRQCAEEIDFSAAGADLKISLSVGLASGPAPIPELVKKADQAMYLSKSDGKNRTTCFSQPL